VFSAPAVHPPPSADAIGTEANAYVRNGEDGKGPRRGWRPEADLEALGWANEGRGKTSAMAAGEWKAGRMGVW
jgi:hypothetical protein